MSSQPTSARRYADSKLLPAYKRVVRRHVMPAMRVLPGVTSPRASARHVEELALGAAYPDLHDGYVTMG